MVDIAGSYGSSPNERIIVTGFINNNPSNNALDCSFVRIKLDSLALGLQPLALDFEGYRVSLNSQSKESYFFDRDQPHEVVITHIDRLNFTVSAVFEFYVKHPGSGEIKHITDGRFDVKYQ